MMSIFIALMAWWGISKSTSAALRYRTAVQNQDPQETLRQGDRFGSGLGILAFTGILTGFAFAKDRRQRFELALRQAQLPR